MNEQAGSHPGGMNPDISLDHIIDRDAPGIEEVVPLAVAAADRLADDLLIDAKTGLPNQKRWFENLKRTMEQLEDGDEIAVWVFDLDGFKGLNDTEGHDAGDELLGTIGALLRETFKRETDSITRGTPESVGADAPVCRLGGDEFAGNVVKKVDENHRRGTDTLQSVRIQIEEFDTKLTDTLKGTKFAGISFSAGYALKGKDDTAETLFAKADHNMFINKYSGKMESLDGLPPEEVEEIRATIATLDRYGHRVEPWLRQAAA